MRKASLLLLFSISLTLISQAQLRVAIVGGAQQSTVIEENNRPDWNEIKNAYSGRTGIHAGFIADLRLNPQSAFYLQPGVIFFNKGRKYNYEDSTLTGPVIEKGTQHINYIDIPMNLVVKLGDKVKFVLGAGPYAGFFFNGKETAQTFTQTGVNNSYENEDLPVGKKAGQYRVINFGVNGIAGIESGRIFFTARYSRGLNDFYQSAVYEGTFKHQVIGGTLGVFLGKPVTTEKKPKDIDKDGIPDDQDHCPELAGTAITSGCPDKDSDGIPDKDDACPSQPGTKTLKGCPVSDTDQDGVNDSDDRCPDQFGLARYRGCPVPDTDKDGINEEDDKCPAVPGVARYGGCPVPDRDQDGVNDEEDKCPDTKGVLEKNGCPEEVSKVLVEKVNYAAKRIQFRSGSAVLTNASFNVLDEVAALLRQNPELKLLIEGHTSADGSLAGNMKLSEDRANSVKTYLVSRNIPESRLTTLGLGPARPLNDGKTVTERALNRRVELKLSN